MPTARGTLDVTTEAEPPFFEQDGISGTLEIDNDEEQHSYLRPRVRVSMTLRYLVMPRGINVGTRNRVPMAELRSKLTDEGYSDVATVLQSGNVIVSAESDSPDEVAGAMQRLLSDEFDVNVPCVVRTASQVRGVLERNPLQEVVSDPSRYLVNFLSDEPDPEAAGALLEEDHSPEVIAIKGTEAYIWTPDGVKAMTLSYAYLGKAVRRRRHGAQLEHPGEDRCQVLIAGAARSEVLSAPGAACLASAGSQRVTPPRPTRARSYADPWRTWYGVVYFRCPLECTADLCDTRRRRGPRCRDRR